MKFALIFLIFNQPLDGYKDQVVVVEDQAACEARAKELEKKRPPKYALPTVIVCAPIVPEYQEVF